MVIKLRPGPHRPAAPPSAPLMLSLLLATVLVAACSIGPDVRSSDEASDRPDSPDPAAESSAPATESATSSAPTPAVGEAPIRVTVGETVITARLADNATARDLFAQLPLTLTFADFNQVEKLAELPRPLSMDGVPAGADPEIGDIGYYAPSRGLVFYYGDVGYFNGIVRIGRFDAGLQLIEDQDDDFQMTIERA